MAKKKRLNNALNEMEKEFIEEKMKRSGNNAQQMMESVGYTRQLKTLCYKIDIKCKNKKQKEFLQNLKDLKLKLNICDAPAGVGKSLLAITAALHLLKNGDVSKVIIIVPTVEASEATKIGFLVILRKRLVPISWRRAPRLKKSSSSAETLVTKKKQPCS